jgi:regulator of nucleoside diphosphate kinase
MDMQTNKRIVLIKPDVARLRAIVSSRTGSPDDRKHLLDLHAEMDRANVVEASAIAPDVITVQSEVHVRDSETGVLRQYTLVWPSQADLASAHISVLAPLGTALLGYREGDEVEWEMPGGIRRLQIERVRQLHNAAIASSAPAAA